MRHCPGLERLAKAEFVRAANCTGAR